MTTFFISDLHLDATRPRCTRLLIDFLRAEARAAEALYILGDLFEAWIGDDASDPLGDEVAAELAALAASGAPVFLMRGNRDFLLGQDFAERAGCTLLPDPTVIDLYGEPTLLLHGDTLCRDDIAYQAFRRQVRDPGWQSGFLAWPLAERIAYAREARAASRAHQQSIEPEIMDVTPEAVTEMFRMYGVRRMIHGHTHRPAVHRYPDIAPDMTCERIVLGDWYEQGSVLRVTGQNEFSLAALPLD